MNTEKTKFTDTTRLPAPSELVIPAMLDMLLLFLITTLAMLPFGQIFHLHVGFVTLNMFEIIYILLIMVLVLKVAVEKKFIFPFIWIFFSSASLVYILYSSVAFSVSPIDSVRHLRFYLPFFLATFILAAGTRLTTRKVLTWLTVASFVSSISALYIHHFMPFFLTTAFASSFDVVDLTILMGRLYWKNSSLLFFVLMCLFTKEFRINKTLLIPVFIVSFATLFNVMNRTMLIGIVLFCIGTSFAANDLGTSFKRLLKITGVLLVMLMIIMVLSHYDDRIMKLINVRLLGEGDVANVYNKALVRGRYPLYMQYFEKILRSFPIGQGFGRPFAFVHDYFIYTVDISLLAFVIPFGVLGIFMFVSFNVKLLNIINRFTRHLSPNIRIMVLLLLTVFILMSLNVDFFSRDNFIIYFSLVVMSLQNVSIKSRFNEGK